MTSTQLDESASALPPTGRKPSLWKRMALMILFVVLLAAVLGFGFYLHVRQLMASAPKPTPATVTATKVEPSDWQPQIAAVGALGAVNGVDVATQVAGVVSAIPIGSGVRVRAGDLLVQLNAAPDTAQLAAL